MNRIELNGAWTLSWDDIKTGSYEKAVERFRAGETITAKVPGAVHEALIEKGTIKEPLVGMNSKECKWMETKEWWFIRKFNIKKESMSDRSILFFEGLDLTADVWLNGTSVGSHNNAFIKAEFDVTAHLREGENILAVRLDEGIEKVKDKPLDFAEKSWDNAQLLRVWMRKPQFCYGWDWTIWLPTVGIWQDVYLENYGQANLEDVYIRTAFGCEKITHANKIELIISAKVNISGQGKYFIKCELFKQGHSDENPDSSVASGTAEVSSPDAELSIILKNPKLWWPNGLGEN